MHAWGVGTSSHLSVLTRRFFCVLDFRRGEVVYYGALELWRSRNAGLSENRKVFFRRGSLGCEIAVTERMGSDGKLVVVVVVCGLYCCW